MISLLQQQYEFIRSSRGVVLDFIEHQVGEDLNKPVAAFVDKTVAYFLIHNVNTYRHWLGNFAFNGGLDFYDDAAPVDIFYIRRLFDETDKLVETFLSSFAEKLNDPIFNTLSRNREVTATPLHLFTHVTTHEFHHKGQMMSMCRLFGHTPPDTDAIRT